MNNKDLIILLFCLSALGASLALNHFSKKRYIQIGDYKIPIRKYDKKLPFKEIDDLKVESSNQYAGIVKKNEQQGISRIIQILEEQKTQFEKNQDGKHFLEGAWFYLPNKSQWIEVGTHGKKEKVETNLYTVLKLFKENNNIISYHNHPPFYLYEFYKEMNKVDPLKLMIAVSSAETFNPIPHPNDLVAHINLFKLYRVINKEAKFTSKICSSFGITEYKITEKGYEHYKNLSQDATTKECSQIITKAIQLYNQNPKLEHKDTTRKRIAKEYLSNKLWQVVYQPHK